MGSPALEQPYPSVPEKGFRRWGDKTSEEIVLQGGGGLREELELCLSQQSGLSLDLVLGNVAETLLSTGTQALGSLRQVVESLPMPSIQASGTSSSAGWLGFCKIPKMLALLLVWKAFVTVLLKFVCSWGMFSWFGVFFHWRKSSVEILLEKSTHCYMMCCCILLIEIQQDIIWQISADSWEGDRTITSAGYLTSFSSSNLFLKVYLVCLWSKKQNTQKGFG